MGVPEMDPLSQLSLPPGFRFYPTDEELLVKYLCPKVAGLDFSLQIIGEIDLYKFHPWDLPSKATMFGEKEWYFFSPRDRKYPNGSRPNRVAGSGYWKATGTDKFITAEGRKVGIKKALVFYVGKAPKGNKTNWIMHEYRLSQPPNKNGSSRLDVWVLCRIYKKNSIGQRPVSVVASKERSHGSPSSSSFQFDDVLESWAETEDQFFNLRAMDSIETSSQDEKINLNKMGSGFDWANLAGLISLPELASLRKAPAIENQGHENSNNDQMNMYVHSIPQFCQTDSRFGGDVNQETQCGLRPQLFNSEFFQQNSSAYSPCQYNSFGTQLGSLLFRQ